MSLSYAVERLYQAGWKPDHSSLQRLPDGRAYPTIASIQNEFAAAGLRLSVKPNPAFKCAHATWAPLGETLDAGHLPDDRHGTVVGSSEPEAAVYALAQFLMSHQAQPLVPA